MWIVVYAPQNLAAKITLWSTLVNLIDNWDGISVTMGDFNKVREADERFGSCFNERQASSFNSFITNSSLIDVSLGGRLDHRPILLKEHVSDFGPTPFRFFHSWLELEGFHTLVVDTWKNDGIVHANDHSQRLAQIDVKIDQGCATDLDLLNRSKAIRILDDLNRLEAKDLAQKARIKWALDGDENSSFFHATLRKKRRQQAIKGILKDGEWIDDPNNIKTEFVDHFRKRFLQDCEGDRAPGPDGFTFKFFTTFWDLLEEDVVRFVQEFFNSGNFPKGCNSSFITLIPKVPSPKLVTDFCLISLIGCQYKIIGKILANRLSMVIGSCVSSKQSTFIKGRNILDGPLILNEVMAWYRKCKKQLMIFKVDFEKAFDSLSWDFLDLVIDKLGFSSKWRFWIQDCLRHARAFILVNGSPTVEFEISRGLRQGDPLSPFLFILAMEGLHSLICKAIHLGIYTGAHVGDNNLILSYLIYADDVIFIGEWSSSNAHNLLCILRCFYLVSGLKINIHKSSIFGVCVSDDSVSNMAKVLGCGAFKLPLKYLGVPVGCNMARCHNWDAIVQKFSSKLTHWNARLLFVGGRLSLIKTVLGVKKMVWVRWNSCMASKQKGGLGIGSIHALNVGLLFKWIWRFLSQSSDLWISVIKEIHGLHGGISDPSSYSSCLSPWSGILSSVKSLKKKGLHDRSSIFRRPPRGGIESFQLSDLKLLVGSIVLSENRDSWLWSLDVSKGFFVASVRSLMESHTLDVGNLVTRWNKNVPIKVNVFLWRLSLNKLPSRMNLDRKGIDADSFLCPTCQDDVETVNHIFFNCDLAKRLWALLARWWDLDFPFCENISEWHSWLDSSSLSIKARLFLDDVGGGL
ncbi:putative RNA-directed DNA polymerase, eukaryota, reverse transcriptase zinc-binding domain protein [Tanacetum coccineum]